MDWERRRNGMTVFDGIENREQPNIFQTIQNIKMKYIDIAITESPSTSNLGSSINKQIFLYNFYWHRFAVIKIKINKVNIYKYI